MVSGLTLMLAVIFAVAVVALVEQLAITVARLVKILALVNKYLMNLLIFI